MVVGAYTLIGNPRTLWFNRIHVSLSKSFAEASLLHSFVHDVSLPRMPTLLLPAYPDLARALAHTLNSVSSGELSLNTYHPNPC